MPSPWCCRDRRRSPPARWDAGQKPDSWSLLPREAVHVRRRGPGRATADTRAAKRQAMQIERIGEAFPPSIMSFPGVASKGGRVKRPAMPLLIYSFAAVRGAGVGPALLSAGHGHQRQVPRGTQRAAGVGARASARRGHPADHLGACGFGRRGAGRQPPGQRAERLRAAVSRAALDHHPDRAEVGQGAYRRRPYLLLPAGFSLDCGPLPASDWIPCCWCWWRRSFGPIC